MEDTLLIAAVERFVNGEMSEGELIYFNDLRKNNASLDQAVVEHQMFLMQLKNYSGQKDFTKTLHAVEATLIQEGVIVNDTPVTKGKVISLWQKYKRTVAVAASIAGLVSIFIATVVSAVSNKTGKTNLTPLVNKINQAELKTRQIEYKIDALAAAATPAVKEKIDAKFGATGFLIDASNNYIVTNAHVISEAKNHLIVENSQGEQYAAKVVYVNKENDMAIIKILDTSFKSLPALPFSIRSREVNLGEQVFILGFPKQEIVYSEGYVSAKNGYLMDTSFCQLTTVANFGNSGSPVLSKNGELVGIIASRETNHEGVVFAIKSANIFRAVEQARKFDSANNISIGTANTLKGLSRENQIKKVENYVFMIKGN